jgi:hypothetical protein
MLAAALAVLLSGPGAETVLTYRLRGEVRPLLFWMGKDSVGGGQVKVRRDGAREEIEVLFGSDPDRTPRRVNRWGYGRESAEWNGGLLARTDFDGIMRHSEESSLDQVHPAGAGAQFRYDGTRSTVVPGRAEFELRILADDREFHYRRPQHLLQKYRDSISTLAPAKQAAITDGFGPPYGFLTGLSHLLREVADGRGNLPPLIFVFNARPYTLEVLRVRKHDVFGPYRDVVQVDFRCFNTVKRTRTEFTLWTPRQGALKALPVRIRLQPRWWLRLQMDLEQP